MASENIMMACVHAGGDRQELHEAIREHSREAGRRMKEVNAITITITISFNMSLILFIMAPAMVFFINTLSPSPILLSPFIPSLNNDCHARINRKVSRMIY